ncbi:CHAT domain-containing protein [Actinomadura macrotermitis]|uniref:CHAT domain-containing protein n=1 Tax=Actinomadura macrotermitis TaxID=2585200 RepID=A0A7K0C4A3_9ACTN|nr:CHAT domain-containing protein [Actinomadura macrotermitis]MQY08279.1 hypothetical protein [Actinomadura macrotermitis]
MTAVADDPAVAYRRALRSGDDRTAGLAAKELGRPGEGRELLGRALGAAGSPYEAARVRADLAGVLAALGDVPAALEEAERARAALRGTDADRLAAVVSCVLARAGRLLEARDAAAGALPRARRSGDPVALAGLLTGLGLAQACRGEPAAAEAALAEAVEVSAGLRHQAAAARSDLAFVVARGGDVPRALALFAEAERDLVGERLDRCRFDRAEVLVGAGLAGEARELLAASGAAGAGAADRLLLLAHAELADGDPERAARTAEQARAAFTAQGRPGWTLPAEHLVLRARWAAGERSPLLLASAVATADRLERGGWEPAAAEARIIAARVALHLGRPAGHLLEQVRTARGPGALRVAAWHAIGLERLSRQDRTGALAAVWTGLALLEEHAEVFGALELRARAAGLGDDLAELGLGLARSARELLAAEERRRAIARPAAIRPPRDRGHAAALAELRTLSTEQTTATARGGHCPILAGRLARLESTVRDESLRRPGAPAPRARLDMTELAGALADRVLVEFVRIGAELHAVTMRDGLLRREHLGAYEEAARDVALLRAVLSRLASGGDDPRALGDLAETAARLDRLLTPLHGDRELVVAPAGVLHGLPWAALPSLAGRPFTVVPSAAAWLRARTARNGGGDHRVLVSGPELAHATRELRLLRRLHPGALVLTAPSARAETVREALDGACLAHIAAHGEFRPGNPLLSRLRLAGGPLLVHDLEALAEPPHVVVLSACDAGRAEAGDAVIGMAGVLLALGTATVVASVTPVRDADAPDFMHAFHTGLCAGLPTAHALAAAPRSPGVLGFLCFGSGQSRSRGDDPPHPPGGLRPGQSSPVATGLVGSATQLDHEPT